MDASLYFIRFWQFKPDSTNNRMLFIIPYKSSQAVNYFGCTFFINLFIFLVSSLAWYNIRWYVLKSFIRNAFLLLKKNKETQSKWFFDHWVIYQTRFLCHAFIHYMYINEKIYIYIWKCMARLLWLVIWWRNFQKQIHHISTLLLLFLSELPWS